MFTSIFVSNISWNESCKRNEVQLQVSKHTLSVWSEVSAHYGGYIHSLAHKSGKQWSQIFNVPFGFKIEPSICK